ncbi:MAG: c-type cytochrome [Sphingomonadales bacterium]|nr:MAG: c-type cytochrome [Sphingomonadales bacterium]
MSTDGLPQSEGIVKALIALPFAAAALGVLALTVIPPTVGASPAQDQGAQAFAVCRACHTLPAGGKSVMGPNLNKLFGRKAGSVAGFNYSPALKASGIVWDAKSLDQYLAAPTAKVPGTRMVVKVADPARRAALIAYLKAQTK